LGSLTSKLYLDRDIVTDFLVARQDSLKGSLLPDRTGLIHMQTGPRQWTWTLSWVDWFLDRTHSKTTFCPIGLDSFAFKLMTKQDYLTGKLVPGCGILSQVDWFPDRSHSQAANCPSGLDSFAYM
jgi:hypothetical protein